MQIIMDGLIQDFLTETSENLEQLDVDLVNLEKDHGNPDLLGNIFRTIHTIKGTCGFIGLPRLEKVAHHGENVLGRFRDGDLPVTPDAITAILNCIDTIKDIMGALEQTGQEPEGDDSALLAELDHFMQMEASTGESMDTTEEDPKVDSVEPEPVETEAPDVAEDYQEQELTDLEKAELDFTPIPMKGAEFATYGADLPSDETTYEEHPLQATPPKNKDDSAPTSEKTSALRQGAKPAAAAEKKSGGPSLAQQNIRVNVSLLENLITSVSELVLARNQLLQIARDSENDEFKVPLQRLNFITSELQEGLMQTRMQPVGTAWSQLPRIIRDLSKDLGKEIELDMLGADTELDRQVIEIIKDPLMHMVRNSADHGLETPDQRIAVGKSRTGKIILKAYHAGGHVVIEISDDGRGLNKEKIIEKIIKNGIATQEQVDAMSDTALYNHIFAAGFSTAAVVTNVSGRGVGMDVVRSNIEKIGGSVEVNSRAGHGSVFTVKIPLTLAIVSALIIKSGPERFAIPQVSIVELVQASADSDHTVEYVKGFPVLRLRNKLLPLIILSKVLEIDDGSESFLEILKDTATAKKDVKHKDQKDKYHADEDHDDKEHSENLKGSTPIHDALTKNQYIIVAQVGSGQFGIIVDEVYDTEEIVVKPVSKILRSGNLFAGNTILGDGSVVMILDPKSIADKSGDMHAANQEEITDVKSHDSPSDRKMRFLIFKTDDSSPKAVPLDLIVRLEEINTSDIEFSNGMNVLQYRERLMPLTSVSGYLDYEPGLEKAALVFQQGQEYVGIVVDEIIDIVEENLDIKMNTSMGGSFGSMVINGHTTDLLDVDFFIQQVCPSWRSMLSDGKTVKHESTQTNTSKIVFIDNCKLYRNLISPLLELQNIRSLIFDAGADALKFLSENPTDISGIVFDKNSIGDDKEDFLRTIKSTFPDIPLFVVGAAFNAKEEVLFQSHECIACLAKNDRDSIIHTLREYLDESRSLAA